MGECLGLRHHDDVAVDLVLFAGEFGGEESTSSISSPMPAIRVDIAAWAMSIVIDGGEGSMINPSSSAVASRNAETMMLPT